MCRFIETIRIENGKAECLSLHNRRLNKTRRDVFRCGSLLDLTGFIRAEGCTGRTRCRVVYGEEIETVEYIPYTLRQVNSLRLTASDNIDYTYKSCDRRALTELFGQRDGADDVLIVRRGLLTDTSIANIALWDGSRWETPEAPLLEGTMRAYLLNKGLITPCAICPQDLPRYTRVRLFNAMISFGEIDFPAANIR